MTDEVNSKLIDLVHSKSCIYDKTDVYYSNKEHVKLMWQEIANNMQLPVPVCQKRWRYLRDYFVRQLHMTQNDQKKSYWALYDRMLFLKPFSTTRKMRLSLNDNNNIQKTTRKRNQSTKLLNNIKNIIDSKQYYYDQNSTTPILSISSSGNSIDDEFNSLDYLNLYQAQFGLADQKKYEEQQNYEQQEYYKQEQLLKNDKQLKNIDIKQIINKNLVNEPQIVLQELCDEETSNENNNNNNNISNLKNYINENLENTSIIEDDNNYIYQNLPILLEKPDNSISSSQDILLDEQKNTFEKYEANSIFDDDLNVPLMIPPRKRIKKSDIMEEMLTIIKNNTNEPDEHEYFFKSLLPNVRKIDDELIMSFRSEMIQLCIKYKYMSQQQNCDSTSNSNNNNNNNQNNNKNNIDYDGENSELIIIDTGEIDWRKKLKNRF